jgi:signal transduction histidine kinase
MSSRNGEIRRQWHRSTVLAIAALVAAILAIVVFWTLSEIHSQVDSRLSSTLQTVLNTTDQSLRVWAEQTEADVSVLASNEELRKSVENQLRVERDPGVLRGTPDVQNIRRLLAPAVKFYALPGFAIIAPDGVQIAAERNEAVGTMDMAGNNPGLMQRLIEGNAGLALPYKSPLFVDPAGREYPVMSIAGPIRGENGRVIAALALIFDPRRDFTRTMELARLENTGETYAFDRNARFLSKSRFDGILSGSGLLQPNESSILNLEVRDPGGDIGEGFRPNIPRNQQPFTKMAENAITGHAGIDLRGYRDYRGVPVIGAWLWDNQLGMGLATEMDTREAFAPYKRVRSLVMSLFFLMLGVGILLSFSIRHRDRLLASNEVYRQTMNARDDMMAIVAHDLRNPINTMLLRSHLMLQMTGECGGQQSESIRHNLKLLQRTANHMNQLIGDLTDVASIYAGRLHLIKQEVELQQVVEPAIERMRLLSRQKGVEFTAHVTSLVLRLSVDQRRITQVLDNLLGNALKFTPAGGAIAIDVDVRGSVAQVSVSDSGPGIPSEALQKIFEPYWQVQKTRTGMGLGLFIAKTIIEGHGGRIWVDSSIGQGTTFQFTLPSTTGPQKSASQTHPTSSKDV